MFRQDLEICQKHFITWKRTKKDKNFCPKGQKNGKKGQKFVHLCSTPVAEKPNP